MTSRTMGGQTRAGQGSSDARFVYIDPRTDPTYAAELDLRYQVLRAPLGLSRRDVGFDGEEEALHLVALVDEIVVGCVVFDAATGRLRAMAVDPSVQRRGIGSQLVGRLEEEIKRRGIRLLKLHARAEVVGFYEKLGYVAEGEPFLEVGIPHRAMTKAW
jgi:GNAT superfamily N-acetyltransferase